MLSLLTLVSFCHSSPILVSSNFHVACNVIQFNFMENVLLQLFPLSPTVINSDFVSDLLDQFSSFLNYRTKTSNWFLLLTVMKHYKHYTIFLFDIWLLLTHVLYIQGSDWVGRCECFYTQQTWMLIWIDPEYCHNSTRVLV